MLKNELSEYIRNGENSFVEFVQDNVSPEQIAKELVALQIAMAATLHWDR